MNKWTLWHSKWGRKHLAFSSLFKKKSLHQKRLPNLYNSSSLKNKLWRFIYSFDPSWHRYLLTTPCQAWLGTEMPVASSQATDQWGDSATANHDALRSGQNAQERWAAWTAPRSEELPTWMTSEGASGLLSNYWHMLMITISKVVIIVYFFISPEHSEYIRYLEFICTLICFSEKVPSFRVFPYAFPNYEMLQPQPQSQPQQISFGLKLLSCISQAETL